MNKCWGCNCSFTPVRSDQMFHSKACRLRYYTRMNRSENVMNQYDVSDTLRTFAEKARAANNEKELKDIIRELKKELDLRKIKYD